MCQITSWPCTLTVKVDGLELPEPGKTAVSARVLATTFLAAEKRFSGELLVELSTW
jgi:hypothetical protein